MYEKGDIVSYRNRLYVWEKCLGDENFSMIKSIHGNEKISKLGTDEFVEVNFTLVKTDELEKVSDSISDD